MYIICYWKFFIDIAVYETHFVPLGERLRPALNGLLAGVLLGLEEGSDHFERTSHLLESVWTKYCSKKIHKNFGIIIFRFARQLNLYAFTVAFGNVLQQILLFDCQQLVLSWDILIGKFQSVIKFNYLGPMQWLLSKLCVQPCSTLQCWYKDALWTFCLWLFLCISRWSNLVTKIL